MLGYFWLIQLSTLCFANLAVLSFEIGFDWKLSLIRLLRLISLAHQTSIFTCPKAKDTCRRQSDLKFFLPCIRVTIGYCPWSCAHLGGYTRKNWAAVCSPLPKTLNLFMTKICHIPYPIYDLTLKSKPCFRPALQLVP